MSLALLLEYLASEGFIAFAGNSKKQIIGYELSDEDAFKDRYKLFYPELSQKLIWLSSKDIIPLPKLYEYVENGFRSFDKLALEKQLKHHDETIEKQDESIKQQYELLQHLRNKADVETDNRNKTVEAQIATLSERGDGMIKRINPLFKLVLYLTFGFGVLLVVAGIILFVLGATGNTELSFFGQTFKSTNIGIAALFIGAVLVALNFRRVLTSIERTTSK